AGCGYVGTALGERLSEAGHQVWGLRRDPSRLPPRLRPWAADLGAPTLRLPEALDAVVYTAAATAGDTDSYRQAYVHNLAKLVEQVPPGVTFLFTSSTSAYGEDEGAWAREDS